MKKYVALFLALVMIFSLAACGGGTKEKTPEIALVTDVGNIDDKSFNEGTWNGVKAYAEANDVGYAYYRPTEDSTEARVEQIGNAIEKGAKVVVCPGFMFAEALATVQEKYPDTMFLGLDVAEGDMATVKENVALITYQEEQAGYLAGYAAVMDGYTKLGFLGGMAVPAVIRYGYGFVQGCNDAAAELGITVDVNYWYGQTFGPSDDVKIKMDSWFTGGTEVVFACGGGIYISALAAATEGGGKIIGVDSDQSAEDELIITSAMKDLTESTKVALTALYGNSVKWPADYAGKGTVLGAADGTVCLPTAEASWRLENYTVDQYKELLAKVADGTIVISDAIDVEPAVTNANVDYQG